MLSIPKVLIIAGSDSGGGAGIQADIKAITFFKGFAMTAITAVTAQNTKGVNSVIPIKPKDIEKQILFMNDNKVAFSFTAYQPISEDGRRLFSVINVPLKVDYKNYLKNTIIGCLTVMINIETIGKFTMPDLRTSHDMALWLSIMKKGYCAYGINENLARYRIVSGSNTASKIMAVKDVWNVYRNVEKLNFFYSFYCLIYYIVNALIKRI